MNRIVLILIFMVAFLSCQNQEKSNGQLVTESIDLPFFWENANTYFLLTDRFHNGNPDNDINQDRTKESALLRGFEGGDFSGITQKIEEGYFNKLGVNSIWFSPVSEQVHGIVDEGTGPTYAFHGYWIKDWTAIEPNFGTQEELAELVESAHNHGIRILLDVIINHTGPVTELDPQWPDSWVRTTPRCTYQDYESTVTCTLVENLPDIKTESLEEVELPELLVKKWKEEGRYEKEMAELDAFFERTGYPRAPKYYIIKWLTDLVREYGVDGFRVDTAKHTEEDVWADLYKEAVLAFEEWKKNNPDRVLDDNEFFMMGEVYNYSFRNGRLFDFGDKKVDFFDYGFKSLINFDFKTAAGEPYENIFSDYSSILNDQLQGKTVLNYISSHDDGAPFDPLRENPLDAGTKLLLCPGGAQIYYGDETSRTLTVEGTMGDATLRSYMNWDELNGNSERSGYKTQEVLDHWRKLGVFRNSHPAVGMGLHEMIDDDPYIFKRTLKLDNYFDQVLVGLEMESGLKTVDVSGLFANGLEVKDYYSGQVVTVEDGMISIDSRFSIILIGT